MSTLKKPWVDMVEVIPILLSGDFLVNTSILGSWNFHWNMYTIQLLE